MVAAVRVPWAVSKPSREEAMSEIDRRSALVIGLATAGTALVPAGAAVAQPYRPDEGREIAPGVRVVDVSERGMMHGRDAVLPGYKRIKVVDCVVPGSSGASLTREGEDALWHQVFTVQPERRREFEPSSKGRKKRPAPWPPATG
jgi:hypothetical protein